MADGRIIIASPCDCDRGLLGHLLADDGFDVCEVTSANSALAQAQSQNPDIIIIDTLFWNTAAHNTLTALKHSPKTRGIAVMVFGQPETPEEIQQAIQAGAATWHLRKGFEIETFIEAVRELVQNAKAGRDRGGKAPSRPSAAAPAATPLIKLTHEAVEKTLCGVGLLPAFDFSIVEAITTTCAKDQALTHITEICHRDPMLGVLLLSAANRVAQTTPSPVTELEEAARRLGNRGFYKLAESLSPLQFSAASIWDPGYFWMHSIATSRIARMLSKVIGLSSPTEAATAGLLHGLGYFILAKYFPRYYGTLFSEAGVSDSVDAAWERRLIGVDHGELTAWVLQYFKLPATVQQAVQAHHAAMANGTWATSSSRVLAMLVRAADQMANALFAGDPPLMPLSPVSDDIRLAVENADVPADNVIECARNIVADLSMEMMHLFPQSSCRPHYYHDHKPLEKVLYFAPKRPSLDIIQSFLQVRSEHVTVLDHAKRLGESERAPMIVNLTHIPDTAAQLETLTTLLAMGLLEGRKAAVFIDEPLLESHRAVLPRTCRPIILPSHPARWMRWLASSPETNEQNGYELSVA